MSASQKYSVVVPMNSSFSSRLRLWPTSLNTSLATAKCSGSLSISTPSISKITAAKRAMGADDTLCCVNDGVTTVGALVRAEHPWTDAQLAGLYDAFGFDADLPLYLELAAAEGGRILELACGSGRVLLPLARAGHTVVGPREAAAGTRAAQPRASRPRRHSHFRRARPRSLRRRNPGREKLRLSHRARRPARLPAAHRRTPAARRLVVD